MTVFAVDVHLLCRSSGSRCWPGSAISALFSLVIVGARAPATRAARASGGAAAVYAALAVARVRCCSPRASCSASRR